MARMESDANSFGAGVPHPTSFFLYPLAGKYFMAFAEYVSGGINITDIVILYEINIDGTATALGCKGYTGAFASATFGLTLFGQGLSIRDDTQEIMFCGGANAAENLCIITFDSIAGLLGAYVNKSRTNRVKSITEIFGQYGAVPAPYLNYAATFVGTDLYVALNKAHMDWLASHSSGVGFNSYYKTLQPGHPNGVLLKARTFSDGLGVLTYIFDGVTTDYAWPFADEGLNKAGAPGQTTSATYDVWSPPSQVQEINGTVDSVYFTRGYSDVGAANLVGVKVFQNGALVNEVEGAPFGVWTNPIAEPRAYFVGDAIYMSFASTGIGGTVTYAKIGAFVPGAMTLADICADVSGRIGLAVSDYDYGGLTSVTPTGAAVLSRDLARSFIESMQPAYFFDLTDIGDKVVGSLRSNDALVQTISEDDLAAAPAGTSTVTDKIASVRNDDIELPQDLSIQFNDINHDYQQGSQQARRTRVTQYSSGRNSVSVPVVMNAGEANNAALRGLYLLWVERIQRKFVLPPEFLARTPTDVVSVQRGGKNHTVRITKVTLQPNWTIEVEAVSEDLGTYKIQVPMPLASITNGGQTQQTINPVTTPTLAVLDTAPLRPDDLDSVGVYVAASSSEEGSAYSTVAAQESQDDSVFDTVASLSVEATLGMVGTALGTCARYTVFDRVNTLTVALFNGALGSASESELIANLTNLCWLSNGEIIQFATAVLNGDGTYTLSNLLRGRFGTEQFVGTHAAGEVFLFLDQAFVRPVTYSVSDIGATRYWRGLNDAPSNPASPVQTLVMVTRRLMPFAPTFIRGSRDGGHNLTITGKRRMRWRGRPLWTPPETDTPVTVEIDIISGSIVVRTLTATLSANGSGITDASGFTAYYAAADQVLDFGSTQTSISLVAYSLNATVGRGYGGAKAV